jgi:hypothetical protein
MHNPARIIIVDDVEANRDILRMTPPIRLTRSACA